MSHWVPSPLFVHRAQTDALAMAPHPTRAQRHQTGCHTSPDANHLYPVLLAPAMAMPLKLIGAWFGMRIDHATSKRIQPLHVPQIRNGVVVLPPALLSAMAMLAPRISAPALPP